jgi:hypothetical protein
MTALDRVLPTPGLIEVDHVVLALSPETTWAMLRHGDLARGSTLVRALFALRTLPSRISGSSDAVSLSLDDMRSTPEHPGFGILVDQAPREVVVGAIGKVWKLDIPFVHVPNAEAFAAFATPELVKVAWALRVLPHGDGDSRVEIEVRVAATDDETWRRFRRYFRLIGPASRLIRRSVLAGLVKEYGTPEEKERERPLPGDELLPDARAQLTHGITIAATPAAIWPWLVQMGGRRAGFYAIDAFDNGGARSAREVHPELQALHVGDVIPATPVGSDGFEVLRIDAHRVLAFGGLYDPANKRQLPFAAARPEKFWQVTWTFVLEPIDAATTRLHVRARGAFPASGAVHAAWIRPVHALMEGAQLRHLKERVERTLRKDDAHDILEGLAGAAQMLFALVTPFVRRDRSHWGLEEAAAAAEWPGDALIPSPRWSWTHAVEIDAEADDVWPWIAQIGASRAGFYSYQFLENMAGCGIQNAESIHPEWEAKVGDTLLLHPKMPPLVIVAEERGRWMVAKTAESEPRGEGHGWAVSSWLFLVEPLGEGRSRFVSRFRTDFSDELAMRLSFGPAFLEPIGFTMDRKMLLGVKARAEEATRRTIGAMPPFDQPPSTRIVS